MAIVPSGYWCQYIAQCTSAIILAVRFSLFRGTSLVSTGDKVLSFCPVKIGSSYFSFCTS